VPEAADIDWRQQQAAIWRGDGLGKCFVAHPERDDIRLEDLLQVGRQKSLLEDNTRQFLAGYPANNVLLWGARGTGKSSLVHGLLNKYAASGMRLVEVNKSDLAMLPDIVQGLRQEPFRFVLFCDDLSFAADDASYKTLKSALEGSVFTQSANVLIYATSNRRHLLPEYMSDNVAGRHVEGELHESEAVEEKISLSDRFGLWLHGHRRGRRDGARRAGLHRSRRPSHRSRGQRSRLRRPPCPSSPTPIFRASRGCARPDRRC